MEDISVTETVPRGLCTLIKYHAACVSRDDAEWMSWGAPYVKMCASILFVHDLNVPVIRSEILVDPIVLSDGSDRMSPSDHTWSVINHNYEYFEKVVRCLRYKDNKETLKIVLGQIMSKNFEMGNYDSRVRSIIRSVFCIVQLPLSYLFLLESQYLLDTGPYFNQEDISTVGSAVTPYRSLQVFAVTLSTSLVMYGVGKRIASFYNNIPVVT